MTRTIVGFAGSASRPSKTGALIETAARSAVQAFGVQAIVHDLTDLQPALGQAQQLEDLTPEALAVVQSLLEADALILGSPVYKGSYSGLFKHLFDLLDPSALAGKPVLLVATGGGDKHALVVEHQLRPLLAFFEAATLPTAVYASAADFTGGQPAAPALLARLDRAIGQFAPWLGHPLALAAE
jgi:FMN reductase